MTSRIVGVPNFDGCPIRVWVYQTLMDVQFFAVGVFGRQHQLSHRARAQRLLEQVGVGSYEQLRDHAVSNDLRAVD